MKASIVGAGIEGKENVQGSSPGKGKYLCLHLRIIWVYLQGTKQDYTA